MKAITVRPPWGWAVLNGKSPENRSRNIAGSYRGPLVIHQGKRPIPANDPGRDLILRLTGHLPLVEHPRTLGAALGTADLVGVHHADECWDDYPIGPFQRVSGYCSPWAEGDCCHLVLRDPRWFPEPIPYRGQLGLWEFPDDLLPEGWLP